MDAHTVGRILVGVLGCSLPSPVELSFLADAAAIRSGQPDFLCCRQFVTRTEIGGTSLRAALVVWEVA